MKFQDKFYDIIGHKKCPSSEKSAQKCIWRKSNFHGILPNYISNNGFVDFQIYVLVQYKLTYKLQTENLEKGYVTRYLDFCICALCVGTSILLEFFDLY